MTTRVKICGVTSIADALLCVDAGADAIGLNFIHASPRHVDVDTAKEIVRAVRDRALVVGVVADMGVAMMETLVRGVGLGCLQLHGDERPEDLEPLLPHAYKALRVADASDVARAAAYGGAHLLVDAKVPGALGGTGRTFDWALVTSLARARKLTLAGGLGPENVAEAIRVVSPYCVDVASGVEMAGEPRRKDPDKVLAFVTNATSA